MEQNINDLKLKISKDLNRLNQSSQVFDEIINDYNTLYRNYLNIKKMPDKAPRLSSTQINYFKPEEMIKTDQTELEKNYNTLLEKYSKEKNENEKNIVKINENLNQILDLKNKLDNKDKKINGYSAENSALKQQNMILDKKNKELNETNNRNDKIIRELKKYNQKLEIDHITLIDNSGRMHMEIDKLRAKVLEMQEQIINKENQYNELMESSKQSRLALSKSLMLSSKKQLNINEILIGQDKYNIPDKLKFKSKPHYDSITSINFNKSFSSYITTGKDNTIHIYDANDNNESYDFSDFSNVVIDACFDNKEEFIFAGSYDKTAHLYSLKNNKLLKSFSEHKDNINCVKSLHTKQSGLTGSSDKTIKEWDFNNKTLINSLNNKSECYSLDISQDDRFILSGHLDGCIKLWSIKEKTEKMFDIHKDKVVDIKLINNDLFLSLGKDMKIKLFDIRKEEAIYTIDEKIITENCESCITVSPDKELFAVGTNKGMIYIVNLKDGTINSTINNNRGAGSVTSLYWRENKPQIFAGDSNGFLSIWGTDSDN